MEPMVGKLLADVLVWLVTTLLEASKGEPAPTVEQVKERIRAELRARADDPAWLDRLVKQEVAEYEKP
jgi:hypothetical protein